jgi:molybdopterin converting factor small subunit
MRDAEKEFVTLRLPSTLSGYSGGKSQIAVHAETVEQVLAALYQQHPLLWHCLCTEQGDVREHIKIFVNNEVISGSHGLETVLKPGQEVIVIPTAAAGN